jgi:hypothetical protein
MANRRYFGRELAEQLERAAQLQPFDLVYGDCKHCRRWHRGFTQEPRDTPLAINGVRRAWPLLPAPRCGVLVCDQDVDHGLVWRVVDEQRNDLDYETKLRGTEEFAASQALKPRRSAVVQGRD